MSDVRQAAKILDARTNHSGDHRTAANFHYRRADPSVFSRNVWVGSGAIKIRNADAWPDQGKCKAHVNANVSRQFWQMIRGIDPEEMVDSLAEQWQVKFGS